MSNLTGKFRFRQKKERLILQVEYKKLSLRIGNYIYYWRDATIEDLTEFKMEEGELVWKKQ